MTGPVIHDGGRWTLSFLVGLPLASLFTLVLLAGFLLLVVGTCLSGKGERLGVGFGAAGALVALALWVLGMMFVFYPWDGAYHQYRQVDGTVSAISSRLIAGDKATNQKFVATLSGSPQQFGINDTRAALLKVGDHVTLSCIKSWQYGAQFGYDCNWGKP